MYGMCHSRHRHDEADWDEAPATSANAPVAVAERDPSERVSDADRERAAALLSQAFRDGVLRVEEFDQRLSAAYAAVTVEDLQAVTADLPTDWVGDVRAAEHRQRRAHRRASDWRAALRTYRGVMLLLVGIWFFTSLDEFAPGGEDPFFWPIFPLLGWGIPLLLSRPRGQTGGTPLVRAR